MHTTKTFTSMQMPVNTLYRRFLDHLAVLVAWQAAYDADVERWYRDGNSGYTYPSCIHGTSRWTDYDNICGACEDGSSLREIALMRARDDWWEYDRRLSVLKATHDAARAAAGPMGVSVPMSVIGPMADWVAEPIATNPEPTAHLRPVVARRLP